MFSSGNIEGSKCPTSSSSSMAVPAPTFSAIQYTTSTPSSSTPQPQPLPTLTPLMLKEVEEGLNAPISIDWNADSSSYPPISCTLQELLCLAKSDCQLSQDTVEPWLMHHSDYQESLFARCHPDQRYQFIEQLKDEPLRQTTSIHTIEIVDPNFSNNLIELFAQKLATLKPNIADDSLLMKKVSEYVRGRSIHGCTNLDLARVLISRDAFTIHQSIQNSSLGSFTILQPKVRYAETGKFLSDKPLRFVVRSVAKSQPLSPCWTLDFIQSEPGKLTNILRGDGSEKSVANVIFQHKQATGLEPNFIEWRGLLLSILQGKTTPHDNCVDNLNQTIATYRYHEAAITTQLEHIWYYDLDSAPSAISSLLFNTCYLLKDHLGETTLIRIIKSVMQKVSERYPDILTHQPESIKPHLQKLLNGQVLEALHDLTIAANTRPISYSVKRHHGQCVLAMNAGCYPILVPMTDPAALTAPSEFVTLIGCDQPVTPEMGRAILRNLNAIFPSTFLAGLLPTDLFSSLYQALMREEPINDAWTTLWVRTLASSPHVAVRSLAAEVVKKAHMSPHNRTALTAEAIKTLRPCDPMLATNLFEWAKSDHVLDSKTSATIEQILGLGRQVVAIAPPETSSSSSSTPPIPSTMQQFDNLLRQLGAKRKGKQRAHQISSLCKELNSLVTKASSEEASQILERLIQHGSLTLLPQMQSLILLLMIQELKSDIPQSLTRINTFKYCSDSNLPKYANALISKLSDSVIDDSLLPLVIQFIDKHVCILTATQTQQLTSLLLPTVVQQLETASAIPPIVDALLRCGTRSLLIPHLIIALQRLVDANHYEAALTWTHRLLDTIDSHAVPDSLKCLVLGVLGGISQLPNALQERLTLISQAVRVKLFTDDDVSLLPYRLSYLSSDANRTSTDYIDNRIAILKILAANTTTTLHRDVSRSMITQLCELTPWNQEIKTHVVQAATALCEPLFEQGDISAIWGFMHSLLSLVSPNSNNFVTLLTRLLNINLADHTAEALELVNYACERQPQLIPLLKQDHEPLLIQLTQHAINRQFSVEALFLLKKNLLTNAEMRHTLAIVASRQLAQSSQYLEMEKTLSYCHPNHADIRAVWLHIVQRLMTEGKFQETADILLKQKEHLIYAIQTLGYISDLIPSMRLSYPVDSYLKTELDLLEAYPSLGVLYWYSTYTQLIKAQDPATVKKALHLLIRSSTPEPEMAISCWECVIQAMGRLKMDDIFDLIDANPSKVCRGLLSGTINLSEHLPFLKELLLAGTACLSPFNDPLNLQRASTLLNLCQVISGLLQTPMFLAEYISSTLCCAYLMAKTNPPGTMNNSLSLAQTMLELVSKMKLSLDQITEEWPNIINTYFIGSRYSDDATPSYATPPERKELDHIQRNVMSLLVHPNFATVFHRFTEEVLARPRGEIQSHEQMIMQLWQNAYAGAIPSNLLCNFAISLLNKGIITHLPSYMCLFRDLVRRYCSVLHEQISQVDKKILQKFLYPTLRHLALYPRRDILPLAASNSELMNGQEALREYLLSPWIAEVLGESKLLKLWDTYYHARLQHNPEAFDAIVTEMSITTKTLFATRPNTLPSSIKAGAKAALTQYKTHRNIDEFDQAIGSLLKLVSKAYSNVDQSQTESKTKIVAAEIRAFSSIIEQVILSLAHESADSGICDWCQRIITILATKAKLLPPNDKEPLRKAIERYLQLYALGDKKCPSSAMVDNFARNLKKLGYLRSGSDRHLNILKLGIITKCSWNDILSDAKTAIEALKVWPPNLVLKYGIGLLQELIAKISPREWEQLDSLLHLLLELLMERPLSLIDGQTTKEGKPISGPALFLLTDTIKKMCKQQKSSTKYTELYQKLMSIYLGLNKNWQSILQAKMEGSEVHLANIDFVDAIVVESVQLLKMGVEKGFYQKAPSQVLTHLQGLYPYLATRAQTPPADASPIHLLAQITKWDIYKSNPSFRTQHQQAVANWITTLVIINPQAAGEHLDQLQAYRLLVEPKYLESIKQQFIRVGKIIPTGIQMLAELLIDGSLLLLKATIQPLDEEVTTSSSSSSQST